MRIEDGEVGGEWWVDTHSTGGRKGLKGKDFRKIIRGREDEVCSWREV